MKKIFAVFIAMLFIASLSFAVAGCGKIEEDSANLQKAVKELKAKEDAKKAAAEVKDAAKDAPKATAAEVKNPAKPAAK